MFLEWLVPGVIRLRNLSIRLENKLFADYQILHSVQNDSIKEQ
jgi:hypothetical protein